MPRGIKNRIIKAENKRQAAQKRGKVKKPKKVKLGVKIKKTAKNSLKKAEQNRQIETDSILAVARGIEGAKLEKDDKDAAKNFVKKIEKVKNRAEKQEKIIEQDNFVKQKYEVRQNSEHSEHEKKVLMWAGVIFFMVVIFGVWIFNMKNVFTEIESQNANNLQFQDFDKITDEFKETLKEVKEGMAEFKEQTANDGQQILKENDGGFLNKPVAAIMDISTTTDDVNSEIEELKKRLEELENK